MIFTVSALLVSQCEANAFLHAGPGGHGRVSLEEVQSSLISEIEGSLGSKTSRSRLARIEATLHPMFTALPKNEFGNLDHSTVRYALHRLFVQRHGWYIKGLEPNGESWNTDSPSGVLKEMASSYIQDLFEQRLGGRGFGLHETAVFAATLEHLVHDESVVRLNNSYTITNTDREIHHLSAHKRDDIVDTYMKLYILPEELATFASDADMVHTYPGWTETKAFIREIQHEVSRTERGNGPVFDVLTNVVEEIAERFGQFQNAECRQMKEQLVALGDHGVGRVQLADFYRPALDDTSFAFQEDVHYLRQLGALDETDPDSPSVIVPNYVNSQSNCIASSSFYSVCCLDECEQLVSSLEVSLKAPEATPTEIVDLVSNLQSSTVPAPRDLPPALLRRLEEVTENGAVQLHGRMFAQWMHHAFPRECPFPHVAGMTAPRTPDEWMEQTGRDSLATPEEMLMYVQREGKSPSEVHPNEALNHWDVHEELVAPLRQKPAATSFFEALRGTALVLAGAALVVRAVKSSQSAGSALVGSGFSTKEHLV